jgi:exosortase A-associated hydrolase 1
MDTHMRRTLSFHCKGETLAATLDEADDATGLLIVSGGNEIRIGAHRGMAKLARDVAAEGFPVFRFDRRGIGDSGGENFGFRYSMPDVMAALDAFEAECPQVRDIVCFGNCDAATALVLAELEIKHLVLANPWVFEPVDDLPPPAAIKARYLNRLKDPKQWLRLISGGIDIRKALGGLTRIASPQAESSLAKDFELSLARNLAKSNQCTLLLANRDATAIAFADAWQKMQIARKEVMVTEIDSNSHSFASDADYAVLKATILEALV